MPTRSLVLLIGLGLVVMGFPACCQFSPYGCCSDPDDIVGTVADFCGGACLPYDAHVAELRLAAMQAACRPAELGTCGEFRYTVSSDTPRLGQTPVHRYFDGSGRLIGVTHLVFAGDECPVDPPALYGVIPGCRREVVETLCRSADR